MNVRIRINSSKFRWLHATVFPRPANAAPATFKGSNRQRLPRLLQSVNPLSSYIA